MVRRVCVYIIYIVRVFGFYSLEYSSWMVWQFTFRYQFVCLFVFYTCYLVFNSVILLSYII